MNLEMYDATATGWRGLEGMIWFGDQENYFSSLGPAAPPWSPEVEASSSLSLSQRKTEKNAPVVTVDSLWCLV